MLNFISFHFVYPSTSIMFIQMCIITYRRWILAIILTFKKFKLIPLQRAMILPPSRVCRTTRLILPCPLIHVRTYIRRRRDVKSLIIKTKKKKTCAIRANSYRHKNSTGRHISNLNYLNCVSITLYITLYVYLRCERKKFH